ncbi:acyl carrier protein [Kribbella sp. NPDC056861]|uniref:acyl carrier protein n=1 Tax=Kribbella sp. NPDC056861 TaxID=3154857 RepID=UPI003445DFE4
MFNRTHDIPLPPAPVTEAGLREWLVAFVAARLEVSPEEIDPGRPFEDYGLDSRAAIQLSGKLEKVVERRLSPALLYQHSSIDALVRHLNVTSEPR